MTDPTRVPYRVRRHRHRRRRSPPTHDGLEAGAETEQSSSRSPVGSCCAGTRASSPSACCRTPPVRIQLFAPAKVDPRLRGVHRAVHRRLDRRHRGIVMKTKRGELSVRVDEWTCWPTPSRPFPDKWHGITDPDTRYRQRYVDLWVTAEARDALRGSAAAIMSPRSAAGSRSATSSRSRRRCSTRSRAGRWPGRSSPTTTRSTPELYLRIAPELYLKRLVGRRHRAGLRDRPGVPQRGHVDPAQPRVHDARAVPGLRRLPRHDDAHRGAGRPPGHRAPSARRVSPYDGREVDLSPPWRRATMAELIREHAGLDVSPSTRRSTSCAPWRREFGRRGARTTTGPGKLMLEIYEKTTEAELWGSDVRHSTTPSRSRRWPATIASDPGVRRALRGDRGRPRARATPSPS